MDERRPKREALEAHRSSLLSRMDLGEAFRVVPLDTTPRFVETYRGKGPVRLADVPEDVLPTGLVSVMGRDGTYAEVVETRIGPVVAGGSVGDRAYLDRTASGDAKSEDAKQQVVEGNDEPTAAEGPVSRQRMRRILFEERKKQKYPRRLR